MNALLFIYALALFFVLTPNVLVKIPMKGSKYLVAAVHALIFAVVWIFTYRFVIRSSPVEGMTADNTAYNKQHPKIAELIQGYNNNDPKALQTLSEIAKAPSVQNILKKYENSASTVTADSAKAAAKAKAEAASAAAAAASQPAN